MYRYLPLLTLCIFFLLASCVEDTLENSHTAEMHYVDLLYALHHHDQNGAKEAARQFSKSISGLYVGQFPLKSEEVVEDSRFYVDKAKQSYLEVRASVAKGELEQAMIQLNRATEALTAARIPGFGELYIASIQDFLGEWLEISRLSRKTNLSVRDWQAIERRIKTSHATWRRCRSYRPSSIIYFFTEEDAEEFNMAHGQVDRLVGQLKECLSEKSETMTMSYVDATDSAVWALVRRFGSPEEGGLKIIPPETDPSR
jgi:predicted translin family RNA/ssDNA-binding protein